MPLSRNQSLAASMSPSFSASAFLQSIIPAPVSLRSAATSFAEMSAICSLSRLVCRFGRRGGLGGGPGRLGGGVLGCGLLLGEPRFAFFLGGGCRGAGFGLLALVLGLFF